jgi:hypothetical protein
MGLGLFAFFGLWETTLAVGAAAVSIPVIIHLLNRRRFKIVTWAAMRFLLNAQKQNTKRMRVEQLVLLATRMLLIALIVLAMASVMPWMEESVWARFWPEGVGFTRFNVGRTHKVLVLDNSLSMGLKDEAGLSCFERARELAIKIVNQSPRGDGFSVLVMRESPTWAIAEPSQDPAKVVRELKSLQQADGNSSVPQTINAVAALVAEAPGFFDTREVYFLTDMQRSSWITEAPTDSTKDKDERTRNSLQELQKRAGTIFVDVGRDNAPNVAVTDVAFGVHSEGWRGYATTGTDTPIVATIQNFGTEERKNLRVELRIAKVGGNGEQPVEMRMVTWDRIPSLPAGEKTTLSFAHKFTAPGTYGAAVAVDHDGLEADDIRHVVIPVKETVPILLVNGKPAAEPRDRGTEFLRLALNPFTRPPMPKEMALRPHIVTPAQFAELNEDSLAQYDCIFLCDVDQLGTGEIRRLDTHLRRGGGVVVSLGDRAATNLEMYNRLLYKKGQGLLPARLVSVQEAPKDHYFRLNVPTPEYFLEPPLAAFNNDYDRISLSSVRFHKYVRAEAAAKGKVRKLLTFMPEVQLPDDGKAPPRDNSLPIDDAALVEWNPVAPAEKAAQNIDPRTQLPASVPARYRGKVLLLTTTLNLDWNTWPGSPSYAAMMQELVRVGVSGRLQEHAYSVGQVLEEYLPFSGELKAQVFVPGEGKPQETRTQTLDDISVFRWLDTDRSGLYLAYLRGTPQPFLFAVNVPTATSNQKASESDLARVDREKLQSAYPGWEFQIVTDPNEVQHNQGNAGSEQVERGKVGPEVAHWVLLLALLIMLAEVAMAWYFSHHTALAGTTTAQPEARGIVLPASVAVAAVALLGAVALVLFHAVQTGDFLGFLPESFRAWVEAWLGIPPAAPGEGTRWHLEFASFLRDSASDPWLAGGIALGAAVLVFSIYRFEGSTAGFGYRLLLGGLRWALVLLTLAVLLPQLQLRFERQGWPDVAILVDNSLSMGDGDHYQDEEVRKRAAQLVNGDRPTRLQLAQALLSRDNPDWLRELLQHRKMKVHLYHLDVQGRAVRLLDKDGKAVDLVDPNEPSQRQRALEAIAAIKPEGKTTQLGAAVRQILDHNRGASLAAVILLTDGVTTEGEDLSSVSDYAGQKGVPLFFVGIGDVHEDRDVRLHDLQVEDNVFVNDKVNFEARITAKGYQDLTVPITLREKMPDGREKELDRTTVKVNANGRPEKIRLRHQPTEPGEKQYVIRVEMPKPPPGEKGPPPENLRLQRTIYVQDAKTVKVLYVEGSARWEYRYVKSLFEREAVNAKGVKSVELRTLLLDSDDDYIRQDKTAIADFPPNRQELFQYDVIIFGDCDPRAPRLDDAKLRDLADFVRERGGGLLMIAGPNFSPHSFKDTPLADVLPVEPLFNLPPEPNEDRQDEYHLELTSIGRMHPIFRLQRDDAENAAVWKELPPMNWFAEGFRTKPLAEVLAVHPKFKAGARKNPGDDERHPLVVQQFVGAGRSMLFGFDETWRWRFRENETRFNQFWMQTVRYLSRSRVGRTDLRLDRQTPYRRGEPIRVTVRFPDNAQAPGKNNPAGAKVDVKVRVERRPQQAPDGENDPEAQTIQLSKVEGSWNTYEGTLTRTPEGKYQFTLAHPEVSEGKQPGSEALVVLPPGELDRRSMNQAEMEQAAANTQGRFYTLANADRLLEELPPGARVLLNTPRPPQVLWNHWFCFLLVIGLLTGEWVLRKRKHLI